MKLFNTSLPSVRIRTAELGTMGGEIETEPARSLDVTNPEQKMPAAECSAKACQTFRGAAQTELFGTQRMGAGRHSCSL